MKRKGDPGIIALAGNFAAGLLGFALLFVVIAISLKTSGPLRADAGDKAPSAVAAELRDGMFAAGLLGVRREDGQNASADGAITQDRSAFRAKPDAAELKSAHERSAPSMSRSSLRDVRLLQSASFAGRELLVAGFALAFAAMCAVTLGLSRQFRRAHALSGRTGRRI